MSNEILLEIACPNCFNPIDVREHGRHVVCDACNSQFLLQGHLCVRCKNYTAEESSLCGQCGSPLKRVCGRCHTVNWIGDEYCIQCGQAMDIIDILQRHSSSATTDRLHQQMAEARRLKELEMQASERRMAEMMAAEEARLAELRRRQELVRARERVVIVLVLAGLALFIVTVLLLALLGGFS